MRQWPDYKVLQQALDIWPSTDHWSIYVSEQNTRYVRMILLDFSQDFLQNIKLLSKDNIYSKSELKKQFFLNTDTKNDDSKTNKESNNIFYKILSFSKQFIKINKSSDLSISTNIKVKNDINEKFVDENFASILGYLDILEESSNLENNSDYVSWRKNINQYILLENSINLIINWLVTKGNFVD